MRSCTPHTAEGAEESHELLLTHLEVSLPKDPSSSGWAAPTLDRHPPGPHPPYLDCHPPSPDPVHPSSLVHRALARWESFSLDYHVEPPVAELINADAMARYRKMFTFLWKLKRVEHALTSTWRKHGTAAHTLGSKCRLPCFTTAPHRPA